MRTRRAETDLTWNGAAVTSKMVGYKATVTYTDAASGEADSLEISINDRDRQWTTAWMPKTGDTLTAAIKVYDWEREGDNRTLDCGFFILDNYSFSWWPMTGTISAVSGDAADQDLGKGHPAGHRKRDRGQGGHYPGLGR